MEEYAILFFFFLGGGCKTNTTSRGKHTFTNDSFTSYTVVLMSYSYR